MHDGFVRFWAALAAVMRDFAPDHDAVHANQATAGTIATYDRMADAFCNGTANHDVSQNINALLEAVKGEGPYAILDFGCGPGRDLRRFTELGHKAVGLDGSSQFVKIARTETGCEVLHQDFIRLSLPSRRFDGIFANASLFHIPSGQLYRVLKELAASLKPGGVLVSSNPRGNNEEGWVDGRYGCFHDLETWCSYVTEAGFEQLHHYYRPAGQPRANQPWLVTVWRVRTQASMNDDFQPSAETED